MHAHLHLNKKNSVIVSFALAYEIRKLIHIRLDYTLLTPKLYHDWIYAFAKLVYSSCPIQIKDPWFDHSIVLNGRESKTHVFKYFGNIKSIYWRNNPVLRL